MKSALFICIGLSISRSLAAFVGFLKTQQCVTVDGRPLAYFPRWGILQESFINNFKIF